MTYLCRVERESRPLHNNYLVRRCVWRVQAVGLRRLSVSGKYCSRLGARERTPSAGHGALLPGELQQLSVLGLRMREAAAGLTATYVLVAFYLSYYIIMAVLLSLGDNKAHLFIFSYCTTTTVRVPLW